MRTNIQKMVPATVCDICLGEIDEGPREIGDETAPVSFTYKGEIYDFHRACLADYRFEDQPALGDGSASPRPSEHLAPARASSEKGKHHE